MRKIIYLSIPVAFSIIVILSLGSGCQNAVSPSNIVFPDSNVSWFYQVQPFLQVTCAYVGCHSSESTPTNGLDALDDYVSIMSPSEGGMVVPKNPEGSRLIQFMEKKEAHPNNQYWVFTPAQLNGVKQWIKEGAKFN